MVMMSGFEISFGGAAREKGLSCFCERKKMRSNHRRGEINTKTKASSEDRHSTAVPVCGMAGQRKISDERHHHWILMKFN
jgi:hypothetical protein